MIHMGAAYITSHWYDGTLLKESRWKGEIYHETFLKYSKEEGRGTGNMYETSKGSKGISGL